MNRGPTPPGSRTQRARCVQCGSKDIAPTGDRSLPTARGEVADAETPLVIDPAKAATTPRTSIGSPAPGGAPTAAPSSAAEVAHPDAGGRCRWCGRRVHNCEDPCVCDPAEKLSNNAGLIEQLERNARMNPSDIGRELFAEAAAALRASEAKRVEVERDLALECRAQTETCQALTAERAAHAETRKRLACSDDDRHILAGERDAARAEAEAEREALRAEVAAEKRAHLRSREWLDHHAIQFARIRAVCGMHDESEETVEEAVENLAEERNALEVERDAATTEAATLRAKLAALAEALPKCEREATCEQTSVAVVYGYDGRVEYLCERHAERPWTNAPWADAARAAQALLGAGEGAGG